MTFSSSSNFLCLLRSFHLNYILMDYIVLYLISFLVSSSAFIIIIWNALLQERDVRIIVGSFDGEWAGRIFCQVSILSFKETLPCVQDLKILKRINKFQPKRKEVRKDGNNSKEMYKDVHDMHTANNGADVKS